MSKNKTKEAPLFQCSVNPERLQMLPQSYNGNCGHCDVGPTWTHACSAELAEKKAAQAEADWQLALLLIFYFFTTSGSKVVKK